MAQVKIVVSSSDVSDPTKPRVSSYFEHDIPEVSAEQSAEECIRQMVERFGTGPVYDLIKGAYTIVIQAPARKELISQWEGIPADIRAGFISPPAEESGQYTATLPAEQQILLQAHMNVWKMGDKAPRGVRTVIVQGDPVKAIMEGIADGSLTGERLEEMRAKVSELLGLTAGRRR